MQYLVGTALVLVTWLVLAVVVAALGSGLALWTQSGPVRVTTLTRSLWWGLSLLAVLVVGMNVWFPLRGLVPVIIVGSVLVVSLAAFAVGASRRGWNLEFRLHRSTAVLLLAFGVAGVYLAAMALGPVTNYDTGLYHLGAIRYAENFPTVPGLANLHFPFGYANVEFPLAAYLSNGPWGEQGFRLLNGFLMVLLTVDLVARSGARSASPGRYVLLAGMTAAWIPLLALVDYWVTSPTQDSAVLLVTIACASYLTQAVARECEWEANLGVAGALAILAVLQRPTMVVFTLGVLVVGSVLMVRRRLSRFSWLNTTFLGILALAAAAGVLARDRLLSGWAQYPLSLYPFPVEWRSADPAPFREGILGFHRDPTNVWEAAGTWGWIPGWFARMWSQWETYLLLVGIALAVVLLMSSVVAGGSVRWRGLIVAMSPSLVMIAAWWTVSPPSYRFAWGPLITAVTIPIGWAWWRLTLVRASAARPPLLAAVAAIPIVSVVAFSAFLRADWGDFTEQGTWVGAPTYRYAPLPAVETTVNRLPSGLEVVAPIEGEQCWDTFPLCTPLIEPGVAPRGGSIAEGFTRGDE